MAVTRGSATRKTRIGARPKEEEEEGKIGDRSREAWRDLLNVRNVSGPHQKRTWPQAGVIISRRFQGGPGPAGQPGPVQ